MSRPIRFEHNRYLGDKRNLRVHDLDNPAPGCDIDDLMTSEMFAAFGPDTLPEARNRNYKPCRHCLADAG